MGLFIGMDEAGYGPNLGPLVITVTVWEVPGDPCDVDLWSAFEEVITQSPTKNDRRLHVADSKKVYTPQRGIGALERSVLSTLNLTEKYPRGWRELWKMLSAGPIADSSGEPCYDETDVRLPHIKRAEPLAPLVDQWKRCCDASGIRLRCVRSDVVLTKRFNKLVRKNDSKGLALSRLSMQLLRSVWQPDDPEPVLIIADKHGGRNRYDELISEVLDGEMVFRQDEGRALSRYRVGHSDIRFQMKAESHFPVALASMFSKYLRELAMILFNRFWCQQVENLKPTKGYPVDARRFKEDIAEAQVRLGVFDDVLWRAR